MKYPMPAIAAGFALALLAQPAEAQDDPENTIVMELKCGNVGADKKFSTRDACMSSVKKEFGDDINAEECPAGVDGKELSEWLTEHHDPAT